MEDLFDIAAGMRDYPHACRSEHHFQRTGNGPADQHLNAEFRDLPGSRGQGSIFQDDLRPLDLAIAVPIDDKQPRGHVEDGGDPFIGSG